MPRPKQRTEELRSHVLTVALQMLESEGVGGFTTRQIAQAAGTSNPAVYELFGDKAGLVREIFFEGFRRLRRRFDVLTESGDPRTDLTTLAFLLRAFALEQPVLSQVMFERPFVDFEPGPEDLKAGSAVRKFIVGRVRRCVEAGLFEGDETDIAHVVLALVQGLASQERAGWLGTSQASIQRRWNLAFRATFAGLGPTDERSR